MILLKTLTLSSGLDSVILLQEEFISWILLDFKVQTLSEENVSVELVVLSMDLLLAACRFLSCLLLWLVCKCQQAGVHRLHTHTQRDLTHTMSVSEQMFHRAAGGRP